LTPKFKDVDTLCEILTYECGAPKILAPAQAGGAAVYAAPVPEFLLSSRTMTHAEQVSRSGRAGLEIILITGGAVSVTWDGGSASFKRGDAVLFPAALRAYELRADAKATVFTVSIP
jgi:mannose-6-phosphate isomerase